MKICAIIGARPQFVKAAALSAKFAELKKSGEDIVEIIIHTGQHYDAKMSKIFFDELGIPKEKYNLNAGSGTHAVQSAKMLVGIEEKLLDEKPDVVLLYGDTNSTLAGALAASKLKIKVAHVEAGMRSFNRTMPEEVNRIVTDHLSDINYCSTAAAVKNLKAEGLSKTSRLVGDVMFDAVLLFAKSAEKKRKGVMTKFGLKEKKYILMTCHRAENTDNIERLKSIIDAANEISADNAILFPIHPRTEKIISNLNIKINKTVIICPPLSYLETLVLEKSAMMIMTDSGGIQKEAFFFDVPCITMRDETEWVETVQTGMNIITGADNKKIVRAFANFAKNPPSHGGARPYGNGDASAKIASDLLSSAS
jgi:UDP-GlcNAc3NAcA epimerase